MYPIGWIISHFFLLFRQDISSNDLSIIGTVITFFIFLIVLPVWSRDRWKNKNLWLYLGFDLKNKARSLKFFFNGFMWSFYLLLFFYLFIYLCGWIDNFNYIKLNAILNAILLIIGIGFAEELIFRGWLMEEMVYLFGFKRGIIFQSAIFSIAHYRTDIGLIALIPFLSGLFLFGLVLTLRRTLDKGSILGCIGLHGGFVGIWYLFDSGLVNFSKEIPYYFLGPSREMVNPIGSVLGIIILLIIIFYQRRFFVSTGRFLVSTVNASFKDEIP